MGQSLRKGSRIALVANDAIGNFVVSTPLLQALRRQHPDACIHYVSGPRVAEFLAASDLIDSYEYLAGDRGTSSGHPPARDIAPFDLTINIERAPEAMRKAAELAQDGWVAGPCMTGGGPSPLPQPDDARGRLWDDPDWTSPELTSRYPFLQSPFIGEIFCRLLYWEDAIPPYLIPVEPVTTAVPDVLIACSASLEGKLWTADNWLAAVEWFGARGLDVGLLGAPPSTQREKWKGAGIEDEILARSPVLDLRGRWTLPQVAGALERCRLVLTLDNGILHIAAAVGAPIVGLYRSGIHRLWAPPVPSLCALWPSTPDAPVASIPVEDVLNTLEQLLAATGSLA
jgi:ADP-heptose:LPS heptosyltransferase